MTPTCNILTVVAAAAVLLGMPAVRAAEFPAPSAAPTLSCMTFETLYSDGKDLCESIFDNSFRYVPTTSPEYASAYTMWWFSKENPNDAITQARKKALTLPNPLPGDSDNSKCLLAYDNNFKTSRSVETGMTECQPMADGCCPRNVVKSPEALNQLYGDEYRWDRCGKLSPACERFFVQEACFYQCDANAGMFRAFPESTFNASDETQNLWQIIGMPIKGDYCDAWYDACRFDKFCSDGQGSFFACAKEAIWERENIVYQLPPGAIAGAVVGSVVLFGLLVCIATMIYKERQGRPMFRVGGEEDTPLMHTRPATGEAPEHLDLGRTGNSSQASGPADPSAAAAAADPSAAAAGKSSGGETGLAHV